jgi:hypothetical protein
MIGICGLGAFSHSFITKGALQMYEEDQMSKANEYNALRLLIATINQIQCFDRYLFLFNFYLFVYFVFIFLL